MYSWSPNILPFRMLRDEEPEFLKLLDILTYLFDLYKVISIAQTRSTDRALDDISR